MDLINIENVTKVYNKTKTVINDLSFSINKGEFIVVPRDLLVVVNRRCCG